MACRRTTKFMRGLDVDRVRTPQGYRFWTVFAAVCGKFVFLVHLLIDLSLLESPRPGTPNLWMHGIQPAPPRRGLNIC